MTSPTPAVIFENACVRYHTPEEKYWSFKEFAIRRIQNRVRYRDFWALNDISLTVHKGETFGVIGRNGAGKSTLLKLVARVLSPTKGRIVTYGRVAPLLELGAGFHAELSGRENIFLNATLLGHTTQEIRAHMDEILDFAQIEGYIDSPLRTYSSGMAARLGFAVATSWEPEILILDEILAVGDEEFRAKCYERMRKFRADQVTILLVSHDLVAVNNVCSRAAWLDQGKIMKVGKANEVVDAYRESASQKSTINC